MSPNSHPDESLSDAPRAGSAPSVTTHPSATAHLATFSRSVKLLRSFPLEQTQPAVFYGGLAEDTAQLLEALLLDYGNLHPSSPQHSNPQPSSPQTASSPAEQTSQPAPATPLSSSSPLSGLSVLDVGGGPGYFAQAFEHRGAWYVGVEPDAGEMSGAGLHLATALRGSGTALPFKDNSFDLVYSSNVAEHIASPWRMGDEMIRVAKPGALIVLSYTVWLGPFGGHETGLWQHYLGGAFARDRYTRTHGHPPKNVFGTSLFDVSAADGLQWSRSVEQRRLGTVELTFPRYHPRWAWWVVRVPLLREFLTSNLVVVIKKSGAQSS